MGTGVFVEGLLAAHPCTLAAFVGQRGTNLGASCISPIPGLFQMSRLVIPPNSQPTVGLVAGLVLASI